MYFDETHVKYESKPQLEPFCRFSVEFSSKPIISLNVWSLQLDKTAFLAHAPLSLTSFKSVVDSFIGWFVFFPCCFAVFCFRSATLSCVRG